MPTNEERLSIAQKLRNKTVYGQCCYEEQFYELLGETVIGSCDFYDFEDVAERLADLIEPEERTCRVDMRVPSNPFCSNCEKTGMMTGFIVPTAERRWCKMPTNEERIDIAARLRVLASHKAADEELTLDELGLYRGNNIEGFDTHCVMELADLIEPEPVCIANVTITAEQIEKIKDDVLKELEQPERTCKYIWDADRHVWFCSECGGLEPCRDSVNYCCDCGARVIGNIDER